MKSLEFALFGRDTAEMIFLGSGYRHWPLMWFRGPVFEGSQIGGPANRLGLMLPADLLEQLYRRFANANPTGLEVAEIEELDDLAFRDDQSEEERNELFESGNKLCDIFGTRHPGGANLMFRYLPELLEESERHRILSDPSLDSGVRRSNRPANLVLAPTEKHYRWSDWWAEF